jgi:hypothetical protein
MARATFLGVRTVVADYLGTTATGSDITKIKTIVTDGYSLFLYPINADTGRVHIWSFLKNPGGSITTADGTSRYDLASDYGSLWIPPTWGANTGYPPLQEVEYSDILNARAEGSSESYPEVFAVVMSAASTTTSQKWQIELEPIPDGIYTLTYGYYADPPIPTDDAHIFAGPQWTDEVIKLCALATAEYQENDKAGPLTAWAKERLQAVITRDLKMGPRMFGGQSVDFGQRVEAMRVLRKYPAFTTFYS